MTNCVVGDVLDEITYAKFQNEIFMSYDFIGVEFSIFLLNMFTFTFAICYRPSVCRLSVCR